MLKTVVRSIALVAAVGFLALWNAHGQAATPIAPEKVIGRFHDALIDMMKKGPQLGYPGRIKFLAPIVDQTFDYKDMCARSVGPSWASLSEPDRNKIIAAFRKFSLASYAHNFRSFDGERFEQIGEPKTGKLGGVLVRTQIVPTDDTPVALNYLLHQANGWKIYDVYLAGAISEVARRRDEFSALLRDKGAQGMIAALEEKAEAMASEDQKP